MEILQIVRLNLQNDEQINSRINWEHGIQLVQAQIQILKVMTVDGIDCDISVVMDRFLSSMHNSFLIRHLAQLVFLLLDILFPINFEVSTADLHHYVQS